MNKIFFFAVAAVLISASCNNPNANSNTSATDSTKMGGTSAGMSNAERNKQTTLASIRAWESYNTDAILKDADKDVVE